MPLASIVWAAVVPGFKLRARADSDDRVTLHGYGAIVNDGAGAVHGDEGAASDEQVGFFFCLGREEGGKEKWECENENDRAANDHEVTPAAMARSILRGYVAPPSRRLSAGVRRPGRTCCR